MTHHTDAERAEFEAAYLEKKKAEFPEIDIKQLREWFLTGGHLGTKEFAAAKWGWQAASRAPEAPVPEGWKLVCVNEAFDDLMYWLDRCYEKGHLERCSDLIEPWIVFDYDSKTNFLAATQPAAQGMEALTPAARDVLAERQRQISAEGWTPESDDRYAEGDMSDAAGCYALHAFFAEAPTASPPAWWPWADHWWKPTTPRRDLEKAGALILAEIERIDRAALAAQAKQGGV